MNKFCIFVTTAYTEFMVNYLTKRKINNINSYMEAMRSNQPIYIENTLLLICIGS